MRRDLPYSLGIDGQIDVQGYRVVDSNTMEYSGLVRMYQPNRPYPTGPSRSAKLTIKTLHPEASEESQDAILMGRIWWDKVSLEWVA